MLDDYASRELSLLIASIIIGFVAALVSTPRGTSDRPGWAVQLYLVILSLGGASSAANRKSFSYRERFLATFFIVAFVGFAIAIIFFGCNYRRGCG